MKFHPTSILILILLACTSNEKNITIYSDFPGGNILVDKVVKDTLYLKPDNRDSESPWFYWYFAVESKNSRSVAFKFMQKDVITTFGPALSTDGGKTWKWLYNHPTDQDYFIYNFPKGQHNVRFSMGMPYLQSDFERFIQKYKQGTRLHLDTLCTTRAGRLVEKLKIPPLNKHIKTKVIITARHHASEMMANYIMEGIIDEIMNGDHTGFLQNHVEFLMVPFMDKDGVEQGDQGKHRIPRDHNRDYSARSIYSSTKTLRMEIPKWLEDKPLVALDLHCPWIKYDNNEIICLVGSSNPEIAEEQVLFSEILQTVQSGPLTFNKDNFLPFGKDWNSGLNYEKGLSFDKWASTLTGVLLASTIETPYANNEGQQVTQESARNFGRDIANALNAYLKMKIGLK